jgi:hypothetical protein
MKGDKGHLGGGQGKRAEGQQEQWSKWAEGSWAEGRKCRGQGVGGFEG